MPSILVVEDDDDIRSALSALLEDAGHVVACAADGLQALDVLEALPGPDLILLDLMMPRMNGTEFRAAQLADARIAAIPVVILSAGSRSLDTAAALGAAAHFAKPFDIRALLRAVVRLAGPARPAGCAARRHPTVSA